MSVPATDETSAKDLVARFRRWLAWGIAAAVLLYVGFSVWVGIDSVRDALVRFSWIYYVPAIVLTLLNYALRFWKWHYLIRRLGVQILSASPMASLCWCSPRSRSAPTPETK